MVLTKQEVLEWKHNPVTKRFFEKLETDKKLIAEEVILGAYTGSSVDETAQLIAREIGKAQALHNILEFSIEDLVAEAASVEEEEGED